MFLGFWSLLVDFHNIIYSFFKISYLILLGVMF